eukprot:Seg1569.5 transcript_id=Seg1569.5/GoldUCD/mRNA.D3Y31 product="Ubiquitin-like modifier-activating enzyme 6" protein_id=Seg1569.5/GoldUCD/D3Y31
MFLCIIHEVERFDPERSQQEPGFLFRFAARVKMASKGESKAENEEIDDSLYSRQRYVLGDDAMKKLSKANVFISGLGGLGIEIAKNVVLSGVKSVTVQDNKVTTITDLGCQFFLRKEDVQNSVNRADGCAKRLAELNPYVPVKTMVSDLSENDLDFLKEFQCVVLTECSLHMQLKVNKFCREQEPQIRFISTDVFGVFSSLFCDFGENFQVNDIDGLEPSEFYIEFITKANPAVITTLEEQRHDLDTGDVIMLKEINGMTELNGKYFTVEFISPSAISIDCDTTSYTDYTHGGIAIQKKLAKNIDFKSLEHELKSPDILIADYIKYDSTILNFIGIISVYKFLENNNRKPVLNSDDDYNQLVRIAEDFNETLEKKVPDLTSKLHTGALKCTEHQFAPLCAAVGGIAAQEVLKSVTGKFSPLRQWLLLEASDLIGAENKFSIDPVTRYLPLQSCIGEELAQKLANTKLFMVGCGAIGCEMLKNFALLGIGSGSKGEIRITDNDLIEKSNLNRQFLFRAHHIQKPKSVTAANSTKEINDEMKIVTRQDKVCPDTEHIFTDDFFESCDIVVNALDNIEARRYVDSRCVANRRPLVETGTLGPKGHVQVIVPYMTESYSNLTDPVDQGIPYCTLKSFPQSIDHTIQWARDKFGSSFANKPTMFNKFWKQYGTPEKLKKGLEATATESNTGEVIPDDFVPCLTFLRQKPENWNDCLKIARIRFERYFNHKAKQLLHSFPADAKLEDGSLFWQSPKRPPKPIEFDVENNTHLGFVISTAKLLARMYGMREEGISSLKDFIANIDVPEFRPSSKKILTDPGADASSEEKADVGKIEEYRGYLNKLVEEKQIYTKGVFEMHPEIFEKDDDSNSHIDFITAASNLRAEMYSIEPADRYKTKRIAGNIIPAIATTTAAVAGLAALELVKIIAKYPMEKMRNTFLNLAVPMMVSSLPMDAPQTRIKDDLTFSVWDRWDVQGNPDFTLKGFIQHFQDKRGLIVSMVMQGKKIIHIPCLSPGPEKLKKRMVDLIKPEDGTKYVDLILGYEGDKDDEEELPSPPVRYFF